MRDMGENVGYARVSSVGQTLDVQLKKLKDVPCDKLFSEKRTGSTADRPELKRCLEYLRSGDRLIVTRLDRLARSTLHLCQIADKLQQKSVELVVLEQAIDTSTSTGKLLFTFLAGIAEFELDIRAERQREGIDAARSRGVSFGRKAKLSPQQTDQLRSDRNAGLLVRQLEKKYNIKTATVYRYLSEDYSPQQ
jgi:DNA invertase Pin-like site-specific DNA recombinase